MRVWMYVSTVQTEVKSKPPRAASTSLKEENEAGGPMPRGSGLTLTKTQLSRHCGATERAHGESVGPSAAAAGLGLINKDGSTERQPCSRQGRAGQLDVCTRRNECRCRPHALHKK